MGIDSRIEKKLSPFLMGVTLFLVCLYPFLNSSLIYFFNEVLDVAGIHVPAQVNLLLLGFKEVILLSFLFLLLSFRFDWKERIALFVFTIGIVAQSGIEGAKFIALPFYVFLFVLQHREKIHGYVVRCLRRKMTWFIGFFVATMVFAFGDLKFRRDRVWDTEQFVNFNYLLLNNKIKCSKTFLRGTSRQNERDYRNCLEAPLNFYKLVHHGNENYEARHAIFLPVGDSVVFASLLTFIAFSLIVFFPQSWISIFVLTVGAVAVPLTLNRINGFLWVAFFILWTICFALDRKKTLWKWAGFTIPLLAFALVYGPNIDYLIFSIADSATPSNLGHLETVKSLFFDTSLKTATTEGGAAGGVALFSIAKLVPFLRDKIPLFDFLFVALTAGSVFFLMRKRVGPVWWCGVGVCFALYAFAAYHFHFGIPWMTRPGQIIESPVESDFLKNFVRYGVLGAAVHASILSFFSAVFLNLILGIYRYGLNRETALSFGAFTLVLVQAMGYQFIAPYIFTGYTSFFSWLAAVTVTSVAIERKTFPFWNQHNIGWPWSNPKGSATSSNAQSNAPQIEGFTGCSPLAPRSTSSEVTLSG